MAILTRNVEHNGSIMGCFL